MDEWYCEIAGREIGPLTAAQLRAMAVRGQILPSDCVRPASQTQWMLARQVRGLFPDPAEAASGDEATQRGREGERGREGDKQTEESGPGGCAPPSLPSAVSPSPPLPVSPSPHSPPPPPARRPPLPVAQRIAESDAVADAPLVAPPVVGRPTSEGRLVPPPLTEGDKEETKPGDEGLAQREREPDEALTVALSQRERGRGEFSISLSPRLPASPSSPLHASGLAARLRHKRRQQQQQLVIGLVLSFVLVAAIIGIVYMLTNTGTPPAANTVAETGASSGTSSGTATRQSAVLPEPKTESRTPIARAADRGQPDAPKAPPPGTAKAGAAHAAAGEAMSAKVGDLTVTLGPVCRARQPSADEKSAGGVVLLITVEVRNLGGTKKVEFLGWAPHGLARGAALIDNFGNAYDPRPVSRAAVPGEGPPTSIYPDGVAREVLAFEPPVPKIEFLSLKLPASVLGGKGDLRFKIPAAKITDQATTEAPPRDAANSGKRAKKPDRTRPGSEFGIPEGE